MGLLAVCFLLGPIAAPVLAAAKKPAPPPDLRKLVKSVNKADSSIVIINQRNHEPHTYHIDDITTVQIDGNTVKFADIKAGMEVSASVERDADDLDSVSLLSKTSAPVAVDPANPALTGPGKTLQFVLADKSEVVIFYADTKSQHTYHIDANTDLKVNGVAGAIGDLKPGMEVKDYMERDADDLDSLSVVGY